MLIIGVYVDDLLRTGTKLSVIEEFKDQMTKRFEMINLGRLSYYLGIEVEQGPGYIELKQSAYARKSWRKLVCQIVASQSLSASTYKLIF